MKSPTPSIPIIDFKDGRPGDLTSLAPIAKQVYRAAHEEGFMYVKNVGLTADELKAAFDVHQAFFDLPEATKTSVPFRNPKDQHGYAGIGSQTLQAGKAPDLKESFISRDVPVKAEDPDLWPTESFRLGALSVFKSFQSAADLLLQAFALALHMPVDFFTRVHNGKGQTIRFLNYPPVELSGANQIGAGAHCDFGSLTLLLQDNVGGLQIQNVEGEWISAPPVEGCLVINTGDLMQHWTNGVLRSTPHRVLANTQSQARRSIAFFCNPDPDTVISVLDTCRSASDSEPLTELTAQEYISSRIAATMHS